jgi:hypothetical protein
VLSLEGKVKIVANDLFEGALLSGNALIKSYVPSKSVRDLLSNDEVIRALWFMRAKGYVNAYYEIDSGEVKSSMDENKPFIPQDVFIVPSKIRMLLGLKNSGTKPVSTIHFDEESSKLYVKGEEIKLGRGGVGEQTIQYWIVAVCYKKPNKRINETDIMAKYRPGWDIIARGRAIRDAVIALDKKIAGQTGIKGLFTYSRGKVTFHPQLVEE